MMPSLLLLLAQCPGQCVAGVGGGPDPALSGSFQIAALGASAEVKATVDVDGTCGPGAGTACGLALQGCRFKTRVDGFSVQNTFVAVSYGSAYPSPRWTILPLGAATIAQPLTIPCGKDSFLWAVIFDAATFTVLAEEQMLLHCSACEQD